MTDSTQPTNTSAPVLSQTAPGLEAAAMLANPLPVDPPTAHASAIPEGKTSWAQGTVVTAAFAQFEAARAALLIALGVLRAKETPELFRAAKASIADIRTLKAALLARMRLIQSVAGNRMDRTRGVVWKVMFIYVLLAVGEVALNTSSGVSLGEESALAVVSFVGLAAGAVALAWVVGTRLRDASDRLTAGPLPEEVRNHPEGTALRPLFMPEGKGRFAAFPFSFWLYSVSLLGLAVANGLLVGWMRNEAGMGALWGPVAAMLVVAAAAPPYLLRNQAADIWEVANRQYAQHDRDEQDHARVADAHTAAQRQSQAHQQAIAPNANAQYLSALAGGLGQITVSQTHVFGHVAPAGAIPVQADEFHAEFDFSQPKNLEVVIDDEHWEEGASPQASSAPDPGDAASSQPSPGPLLTKTFSPEPAVPSGNGHRP